MSREREASSFANRSGLKVLLWATGFWDKSPFPGIALCSGGLLCFLPHYCCTHHSWFLLGARYWCSRMRGRGKKKGSACRYSSRVCPHVYTLLSFPCRFLLRKQTNKPLKPKQTNQTTKTASLYPVSVFSMALPWWISIFALCIFLYLWQTACLSCLFLSAFHFCLNVILERIWFGILGTSHIRNTKIALLKFFFLEVGFSYITAAWCAAHFQWVLL